MAHLVVAVWRRLRLGRLTNVVVACSPIVGSAITSPVPVGKLVVRCFSAAATIYFGTSKQSTLILFCRGNHLMLRLGGAVTGAASGSIDLIIDEDEPSCFWGGLTVRYAVDSMRALPTGTPQRLPKVQATFTREPPETGTFLLRRQTAVKRHFYPLLALLQDSHLEEAMSWQLLAEGCVTGSEAGA